MTKLIAGMSMSLDGYVADPADGIDEVFAWYSSGDVAVEAPTGAMAFTVSAASARVVHDRWDNIGAFLSGRRTSNLAGAWGGRHPMDVPAYVVTHSVPEGWPAESAMLTFVTDGLEKAVELAKRAAGNKAVSVAGADVIQQCAEAGLLDELDLDVAPVLLGKGIRLFDNLTKTMWLDDPDVVQGEGVTHLHYRVRSA
jgi:dihydrofolate reductase